MAAQPLQQAEQPGEDQDAQDARGREPTIQGRSAPPEQAQSGGQQTGREGCHPGLGRIDEEGFGHPPAADEEIGEAGQPAHPEGTAHPFLGPTPGPLGQQHQQGIAEKPGQDAEGRMGKGGGGPRQQGQDDPAPVSRARAGRGH